MGVMNPPAAAADPTVPATRPCGLARRLLAIVYDTVVVIGLLLLAGALSLPLTGDRHQAFRDPVYTVFLLAVWFAYLGFCWTRGGQTLGMRAWRIRIIDDAGKRVGWRASAIRFGVSLLAAAPLGLGFWWSLGDAGRRTWHDRASGTRLVRD